MMGDTSGGKMGRSSKRGGKYLRYSYNSSLTRYKIIGFEISMQIPFLQGGIAMRQILVRCPFPGS